MNRLVQDRPSEVRPQSEAALLSDRLHNGVSHLNDMINEIEAGIDRLIGSDPKPPTNAAEKQIESPAIFASIARVEQRLSSTINKLQEQLNRLNSI